MEPFVALMRKYAVHYINRHDQSLSDEIMRDDYVVCMCGDVMRRDPDYKPSVTEIFQRYPGMGITVHEIVTNGDRLSMRFTEHGCSLPDDGNAAAWECIGLYHWDGSRLRKTYIEQNLLGRRLQLKSGDVAPLEPPHVDPWTSTTAVPSQPGLEAIALAWLEAGDLRDADDVVVDDSWYTELAPSPLRVDDVTINDHFSAGNRVPFHITQTGTYSGSLPGLDDDLVGTPMTLHCSGIATVENGAVTKVRVMTDRAGARAGVRRAGSSSRVGAPS